MASLAEIIAPSFYHIHRDIRAHEHSNYWLKGGRGSTKSSFVSVEIILGIMTDPEANAIVMRKVAATLRDSVFDQYLWAIDKLGVNHLWNGSVSPMALTYVPTGQQIRFKGADKPQKIKSQKFRNGYTKFKHYEEADEFNGMAEIRSINQSLNRGGSDIVTFYSYNPPASSNNWVNRESELSGIRNDTLISATDYRTVPKEWLGREFIADAEQLAKDNPKAYAHEYLGEVTGTGAEVFNNVTTRHITDDELESFDHLYRGLDFGFASDPLAYEEMYYDKTRRRLFFVNEVYGAGMDNHEAVERIKKFNPDGDFITSDREPRTVREFQALGLNIAPAKKGPDSRRQGMKWLQDIREIIIDPDRTPNAQREFTSYELKRDANGNLRPEYPDGDDHSIDCSRYGLEPVSIQGGFVPWT